MVIIRRKENVPCVVAIKNGQFQATFDPVETVFGIPSATWMTYLHEYFEVVQSADIDVDESDINIVEDVFSIRP